MINKKKTNSTMKENMKIVDNILNKVKERVIKLNKSIQPPKPENVDNKLLDVLKDATTIPSMTDSTDKKELEKIIDEQIECLEEKTNNLNKALKEIENKLETKKNISTLSEFWK